MIKLKDLSVYLESSEEDACVCDVVIEFDGEEQFRQPLIYEDTLLFSKSLNELGMTLFDLIVASGEVPALTESVLRQRRMSSSEIKLENFN